MSSADQGTHETNYPSDSLTRVASDIHPLLSWGLAAGLGRVPSTLLTESFLPRAWLQHTQPSHWLAIRQSPEPETSGKYFARIRTIVIFNHIWYCQNIQVKVDIERAARVYLNIYISTRPSPSTRSSNGKWNLSVRQRAERSCWRGECVQCYANLLQLMSVWPRDTVLIICTAAARDCSILAHSDAWHCTGPRNELQIDNAQ